MSVYHIAQYFNVIIVHEIILENLWVNLLPWPIERAIPFPTNPQSIAPSMGDGHMICFVSNEPTSTNSEMFEDVKLEDVASSSTVPLLPWSF